MNRQERIDLILDHFEHPRFHGRLDVPGTAVTGGNPGCGDTVTVYMTVTEPGDSVEIAFEGEGCTVSQAAASMVMQMMQGRTLGFVGGLALSAFALIGATSGGLYNVVYAVFGLWALLTASDRFR